MSAHQCLPQPQHSALIILHIFPFINRSNAALCDAWRWWIRCILRGLHSEAVGSTHYTIMQCINTLFELSPIPTYYDCRRWRHFNWRRALCNKFKMLAALGFGWALAMTALRFWGKTVAHTEVVLAHTAINLMLSLSLSLMYAAPLINLMLLSPPSLKLAPLLKHHLHILVWWRRFMGFFKTSSVFRRSIRLWGYSLTPD